MALSKKHRAAEEFRLSQALYQQAMMHRRTARNYVGRPVGRALKYQSARQCLDAARFHLAQCGALLGLNDWPK